MNDFVDPMSCPPEIPPEQPRPGRTGPTTPDGKERSSGNAITHGCRSAKLILRHEDPAEFEALRDAWFRQYQPETEIATALVEETVRAHWLLRRAQKQLENIEWELPSALQALVKTAAPGVPNRVAATLPPCSGSVFHLAAHA